MSRRTIFPGAAALLSTAVIAAPAAASVIEDSADLFTPSFRGDTDTVYVGWDTFDDADPDPQVELISDATPDIGAGVSSSFVTTNGEDHRSGSGNYYSGSGSVAERITFDDPSDGKVGGFTTIIVQAKTLFGGFGSDIVFSDIDGVAPVLDIQGTNLAGQGQLYAKYEIAGPVSDNFFDISTGPGSFISFGEFVVDAQWSATGFAPDTASVPEPGSLALLALGGLGLLRRRR